MNRDYPDTVLGRAAQYIDMIGEEHGHPASLDHADMRDNMLAAHRVLEGTVIDLGEAQEVAAMMGENAASDIMVRGEISTVDLTLMFQGIFVAGVVMGSRVQAGLHQ